MASRMLLAARRLGFRSISPLFSSQIRKESIFSKEREPPNGFLFNEKPRKPGEKRVWEDWEGPWYRWWAIIIVLCGAMAYYKPDTSPETWARKEALKNLAVKEAQGEQ